MRNHQSQPLTFTIILATIITLATTIDLQEFLLIPTKNHPMVTTMVVNDVIQAATTNDNHPFHVSIIISNNTINNILHLKCPM